MTNSKPQNDVVIDANDKKTYVRERAREIDMLRFRLKLQTQFVCRVLANACKVLLTISCSKTMRDAAE